MGIDDLKLIPGLTPVQIQRHGRAMLRAVLDGLRAPVPSAPLVERDPDDGRDRYDRLHLWRKARAQARSVESDVILPRTPPVSWPG